MRRSGVGSGGGIGMNKNVSPRVRTGTGNQSARPAGVQMLGTMQGSHVTSHRETSYRGERLHNPERNPPMSVPFGNAKALDVGKGGCGTGRTLYGQAGSQGMHGQPDRGMPGLPSTKGQWPDAK
jgi:hypothetical protein